MDYEIVEKSKTIDHSSSHTKKNYFKGLKQAKESPKKLLLIQKGKKKEIEKESSHLKYIFNKSNTKIVSTIISFLEFKDLIELKNTNKHFNKLLTSKQTLREYALSGVMSSENRLLFYETLISIKDLKQNLIKDLSKYNIKSNIYNNILILANDSKNKDEQFSYVADQINKDINRTFYTEKFKKGNGKEMLNNILTAIAFIRP